MRTRRKIEAMHYFYGRGIGICGVCPHFLKKKRDRTYHKCLVYGDSNSEATDWRKNYPACGLIDKPFPMGETRVVDRIVALREDKIVDNQISIFDGRTYGIEGKDDAGNHC